MMLLTIMNMIVTSVTLTELKLLTTTPVLQNAMTILMEMIVRIIFVIGNVIAVTALMRTSVLSANNGEKQKLCLMGVSL